MAKYKFNIFYSWQSDADKKYNRYFIENCLKDAIKKITLSSEIEARLDKDTQGVTGTPDIVQCILNKIENADAIVADVTVTGEVFNKEKKLNNPNVMFELGYAVKCCSWQKIILVVNEAYGTWDRDLPFDLGGTRRWPIRYTYTKNSDKNTVKKQLVKELYTALNEISHQSIPRNNMAKCGNIHLLIPDSFLGVSGMIREKRKSKNDTELDLFVHTLQLELVNTSDKPIKKISGYSQVKNSDQQFDLKLNKNGWLVDTSELKNLPIGESIMVHIPFTDNWSPSHKIQYEEFTQHYTPFDLIINVEGMISSFHFSRKEIMRLFSDWWARYFDGVQSNYYFKNKIYKTLL